MKFQEKILGSYHLQKSNRTLNDTQKANLLFDILLQLIIKNKWEYLAEGKGQTAEFILGCNASEHLQVNCFELSFLFIRLCIEIGIADTDTYIYEHRPSSKIGRALYENDSVSRYTFQCFDGQYKGVDDQICFDQHCVARVNGWYYDLLFSCAYEKIDTPYDGDLFSQVISSLDSNNEIETLRLLQTLNEIDLARTFQGETLLHIAARSNFITTSAFLLSKGVDANQRATVDPKEVPLASVTDVNSELFTLISNYTDPLTVKGIKLNKAIESFGEAVDIILKGGSIDEFSAAMQNVDINFKGDGGWTMLHFATSKKNMDIIRFLLEKGANANITDDDSTIPLQFVNDSELFTLISNYTDPLSVKEIKKNKDMQHFGEAVDIIIGKGSIEEFSAAMQKVDINFKSSDGLTMLHFAVIENNINIARFLLEKGANPNIPDDKSMVPLDYADDNNTPMYRLLYPNTENPNIANESSSFATMNISMQVLGGFMAVLGCAAIAIAFILLNAATFGMAGLVVSSIGVASTLGGMGLFAAGAYKNQQTVPHESFGEMAIHAI